MQKAEMERCPTCQGRVWIEGLGKWIDHRETVGMVCQTCGWNYLRGEKPIQEETDS
jgi:hypothetical protein